MGQKLTERQGEILAFIIAFARENGYPPSFAEIGEEFSIASTNAVRDHLAALEKKGYLNRSSKARSLHPTDKALAELDESPAGALPLVGHIAAGQPLLAEENIEDYITFDPSVAGPEAFCLRVNGDSMIEAGILDGDIIAVDPSREARKGDVVVALVDDEATVKYFYPRGRMVELRPANSAMNPFIISAGALQIQGVVVALQRIL